LLRLEELTFTHSLQDEMLMAKLSCTGCWRTLGLVMGHQTGSICGLKLQGQRNAACTAAATRLLQDMHLSYTDTKRKTFSQPTQKVRNTNRIIWGEIEKKRNRLILYFILAIIYRALQKTQRMNYKIS